MRARSIVPVLALIALVTALIAPAALAGQDRAADNYRDPGAPCFRWPGVDMDEDGVFDRVDNCVNTPKGCTVDAFGCETDTDGDGVCDGVDRCPNTPAGMKVDPKTGCHEGAGAMNQTKVEAAPKPVETPPAPPPATAPPVSEVERQLIEGGRIRLENVYFETASANLLPESKATLDEVGEVLAKFPNLRIEVQGHTDTRGSASYNMKLSQSRSESVMNYLLENFALNPANYLARGYGETQPETQERNDEELLRNRRVVLSVLNPEDLPRGIRVEQKP